MGTKGSLAEGSYGGFVRAFEEIQLVNQIRFTRNVFWPAYEMFQDLTTEHNKVIDEFIMPLVNKAIQRSAGVEKGTTEEESLVDHLAHSTSDVQMIRDEVSVYLVS